MLQQHTDGFNRLTMTQKANVLKNLLVSPALNVSVLFRDDMGARLIPRITLTSGVLMLGCGFIPHYYGPAALFYFALLTLVMGIRRRLLCWFEFRKRIPRHSYYIGTSFFSRGRFVPGSLRRCRLFERLVEPAVTIFGGLFIQPLSPALGIWLVFAGFCVILLEATVQQRFVEQQMDMVDGLVDSSVHAQTASEFSPSESATAHHRDEPALPTGLGADISDHVKRRKLSRAFPFWK
jgi:hypothetical protein